MRDKAAVLARLIALCNELEILPGDAKQWVSTDLMDGNLIGSMSLLQLSALVEEEFGVVISRDEFVATARTLDKIAERIST